MIWLNAATHNRKLTHGSGKVIARLIGLLLSDFFPDVILGSSGIFWEIFIEENWNGSGNPGDLTAGRREQRLKCRRPARFISLRKALGRTKRRHEGSAALSA